MNRSSACAMLAGLAGVLTSAPAMAGTPAPASQKTPDPNEVICEKQQVLGSRLATRRVCRTRAQWTDLKMQDRQDLERTQMQRGMKGE